MIRKILSLCLIIICIFTVVGCSENTESLYVNGELQNGYVMVDEFENFKFAVPKDIKDKACNLLEISNPDLYGTEVSDINNCVIESVNIKDYALYDFSNQIFLVKEFGEYPDIFGIETTDVLKTDIFGLSKGVISLDKKFKKEEKDGCTKIIAKMSMIVNKNHFVKQLDSGICVYSGYYSVVQEKEGGTYVMLALSCGTNADSMEYAAKTLNIK